MEYQNGCGSTENFWLVPRVQNDGNIGYLLVDNEGKIMESFHRALLAASSMPQSDRAYVAQFQRNQFSK